MCTITMFVNYLVKGLLHNGIDPVTKAESKKIGSLTIPALNTVREYFNISSEEYLPTITSEDLNLTIKLCYSYIYDSGAIESRKGHLRDREWVVLKFVDTLKTRKKKVMPFWLSDDGEFVFYKKYLKSEVWKAKKDIVYNIYGKIWIFRVFERLHGIESYPGTGIGLAVVARACDRLGGRFGVESQPGSGSRFWVDFPKCES